MANQVQETGTLGPWGTAALQAGNGAFLGYLPEVVGMLPGAKPDDAERIRGLMARSDAANPKSSWAGFGAGMAAVPGGAIVKGGKYVAPYAGPLMRGALGLAESAGLKTAAKAAVGKVGAALGALTAGGTAYSLFGGESEKAPAPAPAAPAADKTSGKTADQRQPDWYDQMAAIGGVDRGTIKEMVRQEGGVRLSALQALNGMKSRAPTAKDIAMDRLMQGLDAEAKGAIESGDPARIDNARRMIIQLMANTVSADPIGNSVDRYLSEQGN